jgi:hypothetical protein
MDGIGREDGSLREGFRTDYICVDCVGGLLLLDRAGARGRTHAHVGEDEVQVCWEMIPCDGELAMIVVDPENHHRRNKIL